MWGLKTRLQSWDIWAGKSNGETVTEAIAYIAIKVLLPITILAGLVVAFIGFYKIMTSDKEDDLKKGNSFLIWGTVGIITMVMASFITSKLVWIGVWNYATDTASIFGSFNTSLGPWVVAGQEIAQNFHNF